MATCPICGTEVREGAGFCSKCLRRLMAGKPPERKSKKKLIGIIVACVTVISAVIVIATLLPRVPSGGTAELEYAAISAYDLATELFDAELTSLQREDLWKDYEGKLVEWTNEFKYMSTKGEKTTADFLNPLDWARTEVTAVFGASQQTSLLELNEGDLVTYRGILASFAGAEIGLTDCTIVSLPIVPLWWNHDIGTRHKRILVADEVLCLGASTYDDATGRFPPSISVIDRETGELLWEDGKRGSVLAGADSHYVYAWHSVRIVPMSEASYPWYWFASNITALDKASGQIGWSSYFSEDTDCQSQYDCLPDEWSPSDFVECCILKGSVKEEIADEDEPSLSFLIDKPPLSELAYEHQGITYKTTCAVYGGVGTECGTLQALDRQTGTMLWMMTFREAGVNDFSVIDGILYVSTDAGVGAFRL
jgi:predicted nucleic acid-binding Zn ribbon protein